ncbi:MAG: hypothetical protein E7183_00490 [Erysipelotrichaceae bacterium]|nr:hypothetical protein [Erysipelotrichaceae bacterium]
MKRIYSFKIIILCLCIMIICLLTALHFFINYNTNGFMIFIAYFFLTFAIAMLLKIFGLPDYIELTKDKIKVFNNPLFATNKFYDKKANLILWNNEINLKEVEKIELVKLTKKEKKKYIGFNHLFSRYIRIYIKNSNPNKHIYISIYTKKQIMNLLKFLNKQCN